MVGFTYRRVPAVTLAARLVADGRLGDIRQVRTVYLQDWLADSDSPMTWRLDRAQAGSGALGDLGAHLVDIVQYVTGERLTRVSGTTKTFVHSRPIAGESIGLAGRPTSEFGKVTVDDAALFTATLSGGGLATFEATRFATGRKNALRFEVSGSRGALAFDMESMNELNYFDSAEPPETAGFRRILVTEPTHPYLEGWWPPGHLLGYEHGFVHQVRDFTWAIAQDLDPAPSFRDGLVVQKVLDAVERSNMADATWIDLT
jgi:predicted dehydrogenase